MTKRSPSYLLKNLRSSAINNGNEKPSTSRTLVQVGHCSDAVGASDVARILASAPPNGKNKLVIGGCDGACFNSPQVLITDPDGQIHRYGKVSSNNVLQLIDSKAHVGEELDDFFAAQERIALDGVGVLNALEIGEYIQRGGYKGLAKALELSPESVIDMVKDSGLRGRGGAYFPVGLKWEGARAVNTDRRYLVVNSEEGEPGVFKDRHLMEGVPHRIIEGATIAAYAAGINEAFIYINAEANLSADRMLRSIEQAHHKNLIGKNILETGFSLDIHVIRGAGGYVCGEETALINTMEGYRREPRLKPPFPTESGLWSRPTVINNPETLATLPFIMTKGVSQFKSLGTDLDKGTKIMSISGAVNRPGVAEVPMGTTLRTVINRIGAGSPRGSKITAVAVGGPSSGILPPSMLDTQIRPGSLHDAGVMLGSGGIVVLDEQFTILDIVKMLAAYNANESCGKCTPCREGTPRLVSLLDRIIERQESATDVADLKYLANIVNATSLCGLGQAAGNPVTSALHFFAEQFTSVVETKK